MRNILIVVFLAAALTSCMSPEQRAAYSQYVRQHPEAANLYHPIPLPQPAPKPVNCITNYVGNTAHTTCN